jgi:hypothetical protein
VYAEKDGQRRLAKDKSLLCVPLETCDFANVTASLPVTIPVINQTLPVPLTALADTCVAGTLKLSAISLAAAVFIAAWAS